MGRLESAFQKDLIDELEVLLPGCIIMKNDANYRQGIPDLTIFSDRWFYAFLEVKDDEDFTYEPNQEWYLDQFGEWAFSATIFPQNKEEVLYALQRSRDTRRPTRFS